MQHNFHLDLLWWRSHQVSQQFLRPGSWCKKHPSCWGPWCSFPGHVLWCQSVRWQPCASEAADWWTSPPLISVPSSAPALSFSGSDEIGHPLRKFISFSRSSKVCEHWMCGHIPDATCFVEEISWGAILLSRSSGKGVAVRTWKERRKYIFRDVRARRKCDADDPVKQKHHLIFISFMFLNRVLQTDL